MSTPIQILDPRTGRPPNRPQIARNTRRYGFEIALLGILIATSSLGFEDRLPVLSVGITLQFPDVLLLASLGWIAVRWLFVPGFRLVRTPLDRPMLIFYGVTLFSTLIAIVQASVDIHTAIQGIRVFSYYLTFFVVTNLVKDGRQLNFLLNGIFILAIIVAVAMIAQYLLGDSVRLLQGSVDALTTQGTALGGVTRIVPSGFSILLVSFVTSLCLLVLERFKPIGLLGYLLCGLMGLAVVMTFLRSYWVALIVALLPAAYLVRGADRRRLIGWGVVVTLPAVVLLLVVLSAPDLPVSRLLGASWDRLNTINTGAFTGGDENYNYRRLENGYAFSAIASSPVIGLGLGARYRPVDPRLDEYDPRSGRIKEGRTHFIHNSHLAVLLQSGLLGYLSLTWLSLAFLLRGFRNWRKIPDARMRAVVLGFTLVYLTVLIAAGANHVFMDWSWVPVLGIIMGINEVILQQTRAG